MPLTIWSSIIIFYFDELFLTSDEDYLLFKYINLLTVTIYIFLAEILLKVALNTITLTL